jgi:hypothetical protein
MEGSWRPRPAFEEKEEEQIARKVAGRTITRLRGARMDEAAEKGAPLPGGEFTGAPVAA